MSVRKPPMGSSVCSVVRLHDHHFKAVCILFAISIKIYCFQIQFHSILITLYITYIVERFLKSIHRKDIEFIYILRQEYTNKEEEEGKKKINGLDRSVWWSNELSFQANYAISVVILCETVSTLLPLGVNQNSLVLFFELMVAKCFYLSRNLFPSFGYANI